jgi:hypothetical protein
MLKYDCIVASIINICKIIKNQIMNKTVLNYGAIAAVITTTMMLISSTLHNRGGDSTGSEIIGFTGMFLAFIFIFLGIIFFPIILLAQSMPVVLPQVVESLRRTQILGGKDLASSFLIRPLTLDAIEKDTSSFMRNSFFSNFKNLKEKKRAYH